MNQVVMFMKENDCYKSGRKITPKGIMIHSTATPGVMAEDWYDRWNKPGIEKCVHAFIDDKEFYQYLPWNHRGWHAGNSANNTHIGLEICEPVDLNDAEYFNNAYNNAVEVAVMLCRDFKLTEADIICHCEGYKLGIASNHADVMHWFPKHGKSMDTFRADVQAKMNPKIVSQPTLESISSNAKYGVVTASALNVRNGAGTNYATIGKLTNGEKVRLGTKNGNWWNIYFGEHGGWVSADYIRVDEVKPQPQPKIQYGVVTVNSSLNVRNGAGTNYKTIGSLKKGTKIRIGGVVGDWYSIYFGDHGGFVHKDYIKLV